MKWVLAGLLLVPATVLAAPVTQDFARGLPLEADEPAAAYGLPLPDAVYRGVTRRDLGDLRVFDANGRVVQHALCPPEAPEKQSERHAAAIWGLPAGSAPRRRQGTRMEIETADGTRLALNEGAAEVTAPGGAFEYLLDVRELEVPITALALDWAWRTPEGRAELAVRVAASDDLDNWRTLLPQGTLLRAEGEGGKLERSQLSLPERRYAFLRLTPLDGRARDWLRGATLVSVAPESVPDLRWFDAEAMPVETPDMREYRSDRRAPVQRLRLDAGDLRLGVRVSSRDALDARWWRRATTPAPATGDDDTAAGITVVPPVAERFWRVEVMQGAEALGSRALGLRMGYAPERLRFFAQGEGPWLLAYGSAQAMPAEPLACARFEQVSTAVGIGVERSLGGDSRLSPETGWPLRRIVLWVMLGAGALLVVAMALSLLRRLGRGDG
ncbi:DUF3999 family protein [Algiphilus aromaticivorans]|jgi:hypothetical protein|uniref:DUF3999 family protein n=1 Tax=Algiphilus aromaticivorans TaxID=382454 RepID=UPI0005C24003|nr:DUF3999 family protein [Algiphilus aromaticivorans]